MVSARSLFFNSIESSWVQGHTGDMSSVFSCSWPLNIGDGHQFPHDSAILSSVDDGQSPAKRWSVFLKQK